MYEIPVDRSAAYTKPDIQFPSRKLFRPQTELPTA